MAQLTKKGIFLVTFILTVVVGGTGYLIWRVNQTEQLAPTESDASGGNPVACNKIGCSCTFTHPDTKQKVNSCGEKNKLIAEGKLGGEKCYRHQCDNGAWIQTTAGRVESCNSCGHGKEAPRQDPGAQCNAGRECAPCDFPNVAYCASGKCGCIHKDQIPSNQLQCGDLKACNPGACPAGWEDCGTSVDGKAPSGCVVKTSCTATCPICANQTKIHRYCKPAGTTPPPEPPIETTNSCEGGGLITQATSTPQNVGDQVEVVGYAFDADGIDTSAIEVKVNGAVVGNAVASDACPSGNPQICSQVGSGKKPVIWRYNHTLQNAGEDDITVSWRDTKGNAGSQCSTGIKYLSEAPQTNPDWQLSKNAVGQCLEENTESPSYRVNYTVTITNTGDGVGTIDKIVDTLDDKVLQEYLLTETINPSASIAGNVITWDLSGDAATFNVGESKMFTYSLVVPHGAFGSYRNTVVVTPVGGEEFTDVEVITADCNIIPGEEVPQTGLFDSLLSRIVVAILLIGIGAGYMYWEAGEAKTLSAIKGFNMRFGREGKIKTARKRFEKRVVK